MPPLWGRGAGGGRTRCVADPGGCSCMQVWGGAFRWGMGQQRGFKVREGSESLSPRRLSWGDWASQVFECRARGTLATGPALVPAPPRPHCPHGSDTSPSVSNTDGTRVSKVVGMEARLLCTGLPRDRCSSAKPSCLLSGSPEDGGPGMWLQILLSHEAADL